MTSVLFGHFKPVFLHDPVLKKIRKKYSKLGSSSTYKLVNKKIECTCPLDSFYRKASIYKEQLPTEQLFLYEKYIKKELFLLELFIVDRRFSVKAVHLMRGS